MDRKQARRATRWAQKRLALRDWRIRLIVQDEPPKWAEELGDDACGGEIGHVSSRQAFVWVSPERCEEFKLDPLGVLMHELLHVAFDDAGMVSTGERREFAVNNLAAVMVEAYR